MQQPKSAGWIISNHGSKTPGNWKAMKAETSFNCQLAFGLSFPFPIVHIHPLFPDRLKHMFRIAQKVRWNAALFDPVILAFFGLGQCSYFFFGDHHDRPIACC